ncbi:hypothetical protein Tco_0251938 [Tanacetum coccineum]
MASASSSQTKQLTSASNVHFQMADCIIQFNNTIALLKSDHPSYKKLFEFLKKSHISVALTKEPSAYYSQFLIQQRQIYHLIIGLKSSESFVNLPKKETVKEGLASLGLFDETKPSLTSFDLINSSPVKVKYFTPVWKVLMQYIVKCLGRVQGSHDQLNLNQQIIAYSLCWGLNIDIPSILFSNLIAQLHPETGKHERKPNICYTRYLSLVMEHLMKENYKNDKLLSLKPYKITAVTLRTPLKNETPLTAHMCNGPLCRHVHSVQSNKQLEIKEEDNSRISTRPVALNSCRNKHLLSQATHLQPAEEFVVTTDETKSLDVSESAGAQENQNETAEAEKLLDEVDKQNSTVQHTQESPFDTESEILFVKSFQASQITKDVEALRPLSLIQVMMSLTQNTHHGKRLLSLNFESLSRHLDHLCEEVSLLHYKVEEMESSIAQKVSDDIKSSVPDIISHSLKAQLPGLLSDALKNSLPQLLK